MLISRFFRHFKEQNWTAVTLDLFIVIVGIFGGLQVNNWNENRKLEAESLQFIIQLQNDIKLAIESTITIQKKQQEYLENGLLFLDQLPQLSPTSQLAPALKRALSDITYFTLPNIKIGNIDVALSPLGRELIKDAKLRIEIIKFQKSIDRIDSVNERILGRIKITEPVINQFRAFPVGKDLRALQHANVIDMQNSREFQFAFQNALMGHENGYRWSGITLEALTNLQQAVRSSINE